jgi:hypothetical protein
MYEESLRLDPSDWDCKFNPGRLYVIYLEESPGEGKQASLSPEPGKKESSKNRMGSPGAEEPDI